MHQHTDPGWLQPYWQTCLEETREEKKRREEKRREEKRRGEERRGEERRGENKTKGNTGKTDKEKQLWMALMALLLAFTRDLALTQFVYLHDLQELQWQGSKYPFVSVLHWEYYCTICTVLPLSQGSETRSHNYMWIAWAAGWSHMCVYLSFTRPCTIRSVYLSFTWPYAIRSVYLSFTWHAIKINLRIL